MTLALWSEASERRKPYLPAPALSENNRSLSFEQRKRFVPHEALGSSAEGIRYAAHMVVAVLGRGSPPPPSPFDCLDPELARRVALGWDEPCEGAFEYIVDHQPSELARLIRDGALAPGDLSFAAEILGRAFDSHLVRKTIGPLLQHPEAVVREGAIYGLTRHLDDPMRAELERTSRSDPSAAVRTAAKDALDE
jgi:hypothetical protein